MSHHARYRGACSSRVRVAQHDAGTHTDVPPPSPWRLREGFRGRKPFIERWCSQDRGGFTGNPTVLYLILALICLGLTAAALFFFIRSGELASQLRGATEEWRLKEDAYTFELASLEKIRHIPDVIEKARKSKADVEAKLAEAERRAGEILERALMEAHEQSRKLGAEAEALKTEAREALRVTRLQSQNALEEAQKEAKKL
jgi:hypothetical protein